MNLATLTSAIDLDGVGTALLAVAGSMVVILAGRWGIRKILGFFR